MFKFFCIRLKSISNINNSLFLLHNYHIFGDQFKPFDRPWIIDTLLKCTAVSKGFAQFLEMWFTPRESFSAISDVM